MTRVSKVSQIPTPPALALTDTSSPPTPVSSTALCPWTTAVVAGPKQAAGGFLPCRDFQSYWTKALRLSRHVLVAGEQAAKAAPCRFLRSSPPIFSRPKAASLLTEKQVSNPSTLPFSPVNSGGQALGQRSAAARLLSLLPPYRHVACQTDPSLLEDLHSGPPSHPSTPPSSLRVVVASPTLQDRVDPVEPPCSSPVSPAHDLLAPSASGDRWTT